MIYREYEDLLVLATRVPGHPPVLRDPGRMESISRNHPLVDGNKRLSLAAVIAFLGINGLRLAISNDEAYDLAVAVAAGTYPSAAEIAERLEGMTAPR